MFWKRGKKPELLRVQAIRFVGEQDGPVEKELKARVVPVLQAHDGIEQAYLARVEYGLGPTMASIALCICPSREDKTLVREVGRSFADLFHRDEHLDILFLDEARAEEVARVCRPFFESPRSRA